MVVQYAIWVFAVLGVLFTGWLGMEIIIMALRKAYRKQASAEATRKAAARKEVLQELVDEFDWADDAITKIVKAQWADAPEGVGSRLSQELQHLIQKRMDNETTNNKGEA
jgi:hypothetical protein